EDETDSRSLFDAYLTKPIKPSNLYNALLSVFDRGTLELKSRVATSGSRGAAAAESVSTRISKRPLRILLAEDNAVNQRVALRMLDSLGYRADVVANGLEVLAALERQSYHVVLMDMQMPEMDGLEATRRICNSWPVGARPRIIAMTANAMAEHREQCIAAGMDDYIAKPVRIESLAAALEYWGARAGAPHAATSRSVAEASADASAHTEIPGRPVANQESGLTDEILRLFLEDSPTQIN